MPPLNIHQPCTEVEMPKDIYSKIKVRVIEIMEHDDFN
jgi:hypothetical protein